MALLTMEVDRERKGGVEGRVAGGTYTLSCPEPRQCAHVSREPVGLQLRWYRASQRLQWRASLLDPTTWSPRSSSQIWQQ